MGRESLGAFADSISSNSSLGSYTKRQSTGGLEQPKRRGYVRPQGTNFAKSAQSRESVLSLGSIAHLQYYFARTGLLDGKGGRLPARKSTDKRTLDLTALDTSFLSPKVAGSDVDSSYASMGNSPELSAQSLGGMMMESPIQDEGEYFSGEDDEYHPHMLPPTVSTYNHREKPIEHPPTLEELKADLHKALDDAVKALDEASQPSSNETPNGNNQGWYELQGMHILDIMTLGIRAAKMYYTAHDQPARLDAIKSERKIRAELLSVMDVLKRMATRNFSGGMRNDERETMEKWVEGVYDMLRKEADIEEAERQQRASWTWLEAPLWVGRELEREYAFTKSLDPDPNSLPPFSTASNTPDSHLPTPLLAELRTGLRLVKLHNAIVKKSKRPYGAISTFHTDFGKPYRCAENLRFWIKAAELRWEVVLKVDVMGVVNGSDATAWRAFEDALWKWCARVREEISGEL